MSNINIIVAVANNNAIGIRGNLICHISNDLRRFKQLTTGHTVIMGRKTFESLPGGALPNRRNIVITRNTRFSAPSVETATSLQHALELADNSDSSDNNIFIIGGGEIYRQALPLATNIFLTQIDIDAPEADTFFPQIDNTQWMPVMPTEEFTDQRTGLRYRFICLSRK